MEPSQSPDSFNKEKQRIPAQHPRAGEDNRRYSPNSSFNAPKSPYSSNDQRRFDSRPARPGPPPHSDEDNRNYSSDPSFDSPYGPDGDYQRYDSRPARPAYTQRQSAPPTASGAFFAGSYDFAIYGGSFQENKGDAHTDIHYDYSRNSGFGNQYGDRYSDSANHATNYNGPYYNRSFQSASYSATASFSRGSGRASGRGNIYSMDTRGRGSYGRGRSSGFMSAENADIRFQPPPRGIPQSQQQRGSEFSNEQSAYRPAITERGQYDPSFSPRFGHEYHGPEGEEDRVEDDPNHYQSEQMELSEPYPMDEDSPQQQPTSSASTRKSLNPFEKYTGGFGS